MEGILSVVFMLLGCFCALTLLFICAFAMKMFVKHATEDSGNVNPGPLANQNHVNRNDLQPEIFLNIN